MVSKMWKFRSTIYIHKVSSVLSIFLAGLLRFKILLGEKFLYSVLTISLIYCELKTNINTNKQVIS